MAYKSCWYREFKEDADEYKIDIDEGIKMQICESKRIVERQLRESVRVLVFVIYFDSVM